MPQLSINSGALAGFNNTHRFDFNKAITRSTNNTIIGYLPAGAVVNFAAVYVNTAAAGASDITLNVGTTSGDPDEMIDALDLDALTKVAFNTGDTFAVTATGATVGPIGTVNNTASAVPIYAKLGGTVSSLTAGDWTIAWNVVNPSTGN